MKRNTELVCLLIAVGSMLLFGMATKSFADSDYVLVGKTVKEIRSSYALKKISKAQVKSLTKKIIQVRHQEIQFYKENNGHYLMEDQKSKLDKEIDSVLSSI